MVKLRNILGALALSAALSSCTYIGRPEPQEPPFYDLRSCFCNPYDYRIEDFCRKLKESGVIYRCY